MRTTRFLLVAALATGPAVLFAATSSAQTAPTRAVSYINPDTEAATENPDVDPGSSCETPDQDDVQPVGDPASGANNVHNDACLFDVAGQRLDTQAAFELTGPAEFSACPDPDGEGPKTATSSGDVCVLSGYEDDNQEYHARIVGTGVGTARVTFCADPEGNGCADATVSDEITITFEADGATATGSSVSAPTAGASSTDIALGRTGAASAAAPTPVGAVAAGEAPDEGRVPVVPVALAGAVALAGSLVWSRRQRT